MPELHDDHPSIIAFGLHHPCERCKQHAINPFATLDDAPLKALILRVVHDEEARNQTELQAMLNISALLDKVSRLNTLGLLMTVLTTSPWRLTKNGLPERLVLKTDV